ncbi:MAG TPA: hypothetical protein VLI06_20355, partial [Solimonas sp.]|nr:hypothetical protein [Solimonas sp.]
MKKTKHPLAEALLDAHVQFTLHELEGETLQPLIEELLDEALADAAKLKLNDVVNPRQIKDTAHTYAANLELGSGIPELVGDIARAIHGHPAADHTCLGDVLSDRQFKQFLDLALEQKSAREALVRGFVASPLYGRIASELLFSGIRGYLAQSTLGENIPGARSMMKLGKAMLSKAASVSGLDDTVEEGLKRYIGKSVGSASQRAVDLLLDQEGDEILREAALGFWKQLKHLRFGELRKHIDDRTLEEIFVTAYEYWRELRKAPIYTQLIDAGIDSFFERYGKVTLKALLDDLGIGREQMLAEGMRYAPHAIQALKKKKLLEPTVRRLLQRFYQSAA